ncbi:MAG: two-component system sensor histidine kinase NtrB [Peptococcaceae bacterium]
MYKNTNDFKIYDQLLEIEKQLAKRTEELLEAEERLKIRTEQLLQTQENLEQKTKELLNVEKNNLENVKELITNQEKIISLEEKYIKETVDHKETEHFFNSSNDLFLIINHKGHIQRCNLTVKEILGYDHYELYNQDIIQIIHSDSQSEFSEKILHAISIASSSATNIKNIFTTKVITKENTYKWVEWSINLFHNKIFIVGRDISSRIKNENDIARLYQLKLVGQIAAGIGHEVRNPLTTIRGYLQLFLKKAEFEVYHNNFNLMIEEVDRVNNIITQFLNMAVGNSNFKIKKSIDSILMQILPLCESQAIKENKKIKTEIIQTPEILINKNEIRQMILNLITNGLQAIDENGEILIKTYEEKGYIIMSISDNGKGIPEEIQDNIGTPFFTTKENGTGLGLSICYTIAARNNAVINFASGSKGTTFYVKFHK